MSDSVKNVRVQIWLNDQEYTGKLKELYKQRQKLMSQRNDAIIGFKEWKEASDEIGEINGLLRELNKEMREAGKGFELAKMSTKELRVEQAKLKSQLSGLEKGSTEYNLKAQAMSEIDDELKTRKFDLTQVSDKLVAIWATVAASAAAIVAKVGQMVQKFAGLRDAQADVMKTTDLTERQMEQLQERLDTINTRKSQKELLAVAEEAGRLGIRGVKAISDFVEASEQIAVSLGDDLKGDDALRDVGKLTEQFKVGEREGSDFRESLLKVESAINSVAASGSSQADFLVEYIKRMIGVSQQADIAIQDQLGYAAVFDESGQKVVASATATSKAMSKMYTETETFAEIAGMSLSDFSAITERDANEAFIRYLEGLNNNNEGLGKMAELLEDSERSGERAKIALSVLASNVDKLRERQNQANIALQEGTSITEEYNKKNNNLAGNLEKIRNYFEKKLTDNFVTRAFEDLTAWAVRFTEVPVEEKLIAEQTELNGLVTL